MTHFNLGLDLAVNRALDHAEGHGGLLDELHRLGIQDGLAVDIRCLSQETTDRLDDYLN